MLFFRFDSYEIRTSAPNSYFGTNIIESDSVFILFRLVLSSTCSFFAFFVFKVKFIMKNFGIAKSVIVHFLVVVNVLCRMKHHNYGMAVVKYQAI